MSDVAKAIYMACSALLFIFAATTSIYLYSTLNTYLDSATGLANVYDRVEGEVVNATPKKREITFAEICLTVTNMDQMHVTEVSVSSYTFKKDDSEEDITDKLKNLKSSGIDFTSLSYSSTTDPNDPNSKIVSYK